ncbi:THO complex subunit 3, partial [Coemansia biformis]
YEKVVHLWDQRSASVVAKLTTGRTNSDICWSASGKHLAVASREEGIEIFDVAQPQSAVVSADVDGTINSVKWSADGSLLLLCTHVGTVEVFAWPSMEHLTAIPAHAASCNTVGVDPRGRLFATGGADATMELWNADDFSLAHTIDGYDSPLLFAGFSMDGRFVASASDDPEIKIHDTFAGELVHRLKLDALTTAMAWHPRNLAFAYGSSGSTKSSAKPSLTIFL